MSEDAIEIVARLGRQARAAADRLAVTPGEVKDRALRAAAEAVRDGCSRLLEANARDLEDAAHLRASMVDRLRLDEARVEAIARGLEEVAGLPDPVGSVAASWTRPNGLRFERVRTPLGVVGIIYESRPNVTADAGGLCLKSGNAAILRGGSESFHSSMAIVGALHEGLEAAGLPKACIQLVPVRDRAAVGAMLSMRGAVDVVVPRGGKGLIQRVLDEARVPVIGHLEGLCHVYVDGAADLEKARRVAINAKMRRTGICGAAETILFDRAVAESHMPAILDDLIAAGCEVRGDTEVCAMDGRAVPAGEEDWNTEYLDAVISARVVDGVEGAVSHIRRYGSQHTDTILTEDEAAAEHFLAHVDSAIVLHNASTQFADGGEFGFGAEIGISTDKFHARGPVGAEQLTSYKYVVRGDGTVRP